jgi:hypothetical protein
MLATWSRVENVFKADDKLDALQELKQHTVYVGK